jgi:hypothetical protein
LAGRQLQSHPLGRVLITCLTRCGACIWCSVPVDWAEGNPQDGACSRPDVGVATACTTSAPRMQSVFQFLAESGVAASMEALQMSLGGSLPGILPPVAPAKQPLPEPAVRPPLLPAAGSTGAAGGPDIVHPAGTEGAVPGQTHPHTLAIDFSGSPNIAWPRGSGLSDLPTRKCQE